MMSDLKLIKTVPILVCALLILVFLQPFLGAMNFSPAFDEMSHLPSGYSYLKTGEIKFNIQHPPFVKLLAAIPLIFLNPTMPDINKYTSEWAFGKDFLFNSGNNADQLMFWGRIPIILLSVLLAFFIFKWASEMYSPKIGLAALFVYSFMPTVIAHAEFVTTDIAVSAFSFITFYWLWKFSRTKLTKHLIYGGMALSLALGSKFSAVLLIPIIIALIWLYMRRNVKAKDGRTKKYFKIIFSLFGIAFFIIWALYFFTGDPSFYIKGVQSVSADHNPNFFYYLNGQFRQGGWWYYFIVAFLLKTPLPFLSLLLVSLLMFARHKIAPFEKISLLAIAAVFLFVISWKANDIGVRYLLPIYPFLILYAVGILEPLWNTLRKYFSAKIVVTALVLIAAWYVFSAVAVYPDYIAYANELIGGTKNTYKHLDDSNLEWRQDLKRLADYQKKFPETKVIFSSFNFVNLAYYGIRNDVSSEKWWIKPSGRYAINTHFLVRTKQLSESIKDPSLNWMELYKPIDRIGQSFFIYNF